MPDEKKEVKPARAVEKLEPEALKILVENLKTAITQIERYLLIGLGASIFVAVLATTQAAVKGNESPAKGNESSVKANEPLVDLHSGYLPGPVSVTTAKDLAVFSYLAVTWLASIYLARADRIAALLRNYSPILLKVTVTYPSIPTIRSTFVRLGPVIVPLLLFAYAAYRFDYLPNEQGRIFAWLLFAAPALTLASYMWHPISDFEWEGFSD